MKPYDSNGARVGMAVNCANAYLISKQKELSPEGWAKLVVSYAESLLKELKERRLG